MIFFIFSSIAAQILTDARASVCLSVATAMYSLNTDYDSLSYPKAYFPGT